MIEYHTCSATPARLHCPHSPGRAGQPPAPHDPEHEASARHAGHARPGPLGHGVGILRIPACPVGVLVGMLRSTQQARGHAAFYAACPRVCLAGQSGHACGSSFCGEHGLPHCQCPSVPAWAPERDIRMLQSACPRTGHASIPWSMPLTMPSMPASRRSMPTPCLAIGNARA